MKVFGRLRTGMCAVFWCGKNIAWKIIDGDIKIMKTEEKYTEQEKQCLEKHLYLVIKNLNAFAGYKDVWKIEVWNNFLYNAYRESAKNYFQMVQPSKYNFQQIFNQTLKKRKRDYLRYLGRKKRYVEGGIISYDMTEPEGKILFEDYMSDICLSAEEYVIKKLLFEEFCNRCINEVERIPQSSIKMELKLLMQGYTRKEIIEKVSNEYGSSIKRYALTKDIKHFRKIFHEVFGF